MKVLMFTAVLALASVSAFANTTVVKKSVTHDVEHKHVENAGDHEHIEAHHKEHDHAAHHPDHAKAVKAESVKKETKKVVK